MTDYFNICFAAILGHEGGYSDDRRDRGNWTGGEIGHGELRGTKFGISAAAYPVLDIVNLTVDQAREIYRADYWAKIHGADLPPAVALVTFDAAVNAGPGAAARWLQQSIGAKPDGVVGPVTLQAVRRYCDANTVRSLVIDLLARRAEHNRTAPTVHIHGLGWSRRLFRLALDVGAGLAGEG
ncbi:glycoside hydrolase family 108 protein [Ferrovibrio sp.]|uniref:glycoside hydrolase family 108 protein n=1 Tax=Ferrovibrio sp. TaxID=1917215 RepID=UPI003D0EF75B